MVFKDILRAPDEELMFAEQTSCGYCGYTFKKSSEKCFDHSHVSGITK